MHIYKNVIALFYALFLFCLYGEQENCYQKKKNMFIASVRQKITVTCYNQDIATVSDASCIPLHPHYFTSSETNNGISRVKNVFANINKPAPRHFAHQTQCILILK